MKKRILILMAILISFGMGFTLKTITTKNPEDKSNIRKVIGIGGIFFKCKSPAKIKQWYKLHLGLEIDNYGATFEWRQAEDSTKKGYTVWSPFKDSTKYFEPSNKDFMINYMVVGLEALVGELKKEGVCILDTIENYDYGKFVHIMDIEGNKIELWEPKDM